MTMLRPTTAPMQFAAALTAITAVALSPPAAADTGTSATQSRYASCIVTVTPGTSATPLDVDTIGAIVDSVGVRGKAVAEVLGLASSPDDGVIGISFSALPESALDDEVRDLLGTPISGRLVIDYFGEADEYRAGADALLKAITARLAAVIEEQGTAQHAALDRRRAVTAEDVKQTQARLAELHQIANVLRAEAGRSDLSREAIAEEVRELESELRESELELASQRARREAIAAQIARIAEHVKSPPSPTETTAALHKIIELREMQAERMRRLLDAGQAPPTEVQQAEVELVMARAELARHLEESAQAAGGGAIAGLNEQLMELSIEAVEVEARQQALKERLEQIRATKLLDLADRYEREVRVQREVAEEMLEEALRRHEVAERVLRSYQPPSIIVVGGM